MTLRYITAFPPDVETAPPTPGAQFGGALAMLDGDSGDVFSSMPPPGPQGIQGQQGERGAPGQDGDSYGDEWMWPPHQPLMVSTGPRLLGRTANYGPATEIGLGAALSVASGSLSVADGDYGDVVVTFTGGTWTVQSVSASAMPALTGEVTTAAGAVETLLAVARAKRYCQILKDPGAATATAIGEPAPTLDGATVANGDGTSGPIVIHITTALVNSSGGLVSADFTRFRRDWNPERNFRVATQGSVAEIRLWVGMFSASPDALGDLTTIHGCAFRYDTGVDGTAFWRCVTGNASGTDTTTTTSVAVAASTFYTMRIKCSGSDVFFYIDTALVATHTATLPTSTQLMGYGIRVTTLAAVTAKRIGWGRVLFLCD